MKYLFAGFILLLCSCSNEKIIQLPEISNSEIIEVLDVSAAYIFYNETLADSVELNRKNLISTTNWLVNVDKRLTLDQAIPKIIFLQDKKRNAEIHKNEAAKNYFTCHDTSINNLGFIEFTNVEYEFIKLQKVEHNFHQTVSKRIILLDNPNNPISMFTITFNSDYTIYLNNETFSVDDFSNKINQLVKNPQYKKIELKLNFSHELSFQDYITFKSLILELELDNITIDNNEFIY